MGVEWVKGSTRVHVEGMTCGKCVYYIETKMRVMGGVLDVTVSLEQKEATTSYTIAKEVDNVGTKFTACLISLLVKLRTLK